MHIATPRIDAISLSNVDVFNITASRVRVRPQFYGVGRWYKQAGGFVCRVTGSELLTVPNLAP
jgi:hypothetical protein